MEQITSRQIRGVFYAIEVNLLLWIAVVVSVWRSSAGPFTRQVATAGFVVSAILQHWAYYRLYKKARKDV